ncbi:MAG: phosphatidylserine decarboxylase family protein [Bacteroidetes bacterium]|nr:phosphatidylserine decarboxylase family protein [Bacteroidota bacterium]
MRIHREGYLIILVTTLLLGLLNFGVHWFAGDGIVTQIIMLLSIVMYVLVVQFFRNPLRFTQIDPNTIIAPADGKVVVIEEVEEPEYFKDKRRQVSIFMSPLNVHVNRNPISGEVCYVRYYPGKYLVAWHPKSSTENERTTVVIDQGGRKVLFRQIAGALARRIIYYVKEGQQVRQGREMGFIRFGSRIDLFLPLDAKISVKLGEKTTGGETVIARFD